MTNVTDKPLPFDIVAFVCALISAPIVVTLVTGVTIIPIFALVFGAPLYLIVGTPTLLWMVGRYPPQFFPFALAGITSIIVLLGGTAVLHLICPDLGAVEYQPYLMMGAVFAPLWAGTFAPLYRAWNRQSRFAILS